MKNKRVYEIQSVSYGPKPFRSENRYVIWQRMRIAFYTAWATVLFGLLQLLVHPFAQNIHLTVVGK